MTHFNSSPPHLYHHSLLLPKEMSSESALSLRVPSTSPIRATSLLPSSAPSASPLISPRLLWAVKMHILQFSSNSGTFRYSSLKPDHPILLDTHPTLLHLLCTAPGSHAALAFPRILQTALLAPSPPVSGQSGLGYYAFLVSPWFLD